jgi:hypothetical protein
MYSLYTQHFHKFKKVFFENFENFQNLGKTEKLYNKVLNVLKDVENLCNSEWCITWLKSEKSVM